MSTSKRSIWSYHSVNTLAFPGAGQQTWMNEEEKNSPLHPTAREAKALNLLEAENKLAALPVLP